MLDNTKEVVVTFPNLDIPIDLLMKVYNQGIEEGIEVEPLNCGFIGNLKNVKWFRARVKEINEVIAPHKNLTVAEMHSGNMSMHDVNSETYWL